MIYFENLFGKIDICFGTNITYIRSDSILIKKNEESFYFINLIEIKHKNCFFS